MFWVKTSKCEKTITRPTNTNSSYFFGTRLSSFYINLPFIIYFSICCLLLLESDILCLDFSYRLSILCYLYSHFSKVCIQLLFLKKSTILINTICSFFALHTNLPTLWQLNQIKTWTSREQLDYLSCPTKTNKQTNPTISQLCSIFAFSRNPL